MTNRIVDTSVVMAILLDEPGHHVGVRLAMGARLCSVSLAELISKCIEKSVPPQIARDYIRDSNMSIVAFDPEMAVLAGELFKVAKRGVLSLGDRACIASAIRLGATVATADRAWAEIDLPCPVELIR